MFEKIKRRIRIITNSRKIVKKFLIEKNRLIVKVIEEECPGETLKYIYESDLSEIDTWSIWKSTKVLKNLSPTNAISTCPWCLVSSCCSKCGYMKRHKACSKYDSLYIKIINITKSILGIPGIIELVNKYKWDSLLNKFGLEHIGF